MEEQAIKLPVFRTFFRAVGFTIWNGWTIFRLTWFPITLMIFVALAPMFAALSRGGPAFLDLELNSLVYAVQLPINLLQLIATASAAVAIHRVILFADRQPGHYFLFAFGRTELLYLLMAVATAIFTILAMAVVFVPFLLLVSGGDPIQYFKDLSPKPDNPTVSAEFWALMSGYFLAWMFAMYFALRLAVWPPAIVATKLFSLGAAWRLTKGNVLRLLAVILMPLLILLGVILAFSGSLYYYGPSKDRMPTERPGEVEQMKPAQETVPALNALSIFGSSFLQQLSGERQQVVARVEKGGKIEAPKKSSRVSNSFLLNYFLFLLFFMIYATAYGVAILSFSYKALKGYDPHEPVPSDS